MSMTKVCEDCGYSYLECQCLSRCPECEQTIDYCECNDFPDDYDPYGYDRDDY